MALPLFHKNALRGTVKPMLYAGGSFVLMPGYEPRAYLEALAKYKCTYSRGVAAVFTMFLQHRDLLKTLDLSDAAQHDHRLGGGDARAAGAVERALPHIKVEESYGLTEGGSPLRPPIDGRPVPRGSPGVQAPEIEIKLIDADGNETDDEGELLIRCPYVCLGYYNEPEITRAKLNDGWLRTGDIFVQGQGRLLSISAAASTTCSAAAARTSIRRRSRTCCSRIPTWSTRWSRRCRIRSRASCPPRW